jgi:hypothetical protein
MHWLQVDGINSSVNYLLEICKAIAFESVNLLESLKPEFSDPLTAYPPKHWRHTPCYASVPRALSHPLSHPVTLWATGIILNDL